MKVVYINGYGASDQLEIKEIALPKIKDNEVLVKVKNSSVTQADIMMLTGKPYISRLFLGFKRPKNPVPGTGFAGTIEAIGKDVDNYTIGDSVFGETTLGFSTNAEFVAVPMDGVILPKPEKLSFPAAATYGDGLVTSLNFLQEIGKVKLGQKVLINGASGSLGTAAVQLAAYFGAEVTGVCSTKNVALVYELGADHVIDYTKTDFTKSTEKYDIIYDTIGKSSYGKCKKVLSKKGQYLTPVLKFSVLLQSMWSGLFTSKKAKFAATGMKKNAELQTLLMQLVTIFETEGIQSIIDKNYPLAEVTQAHDYVASGHKVGNVVLTSNS